MADKALKNVRQSRIKTAREIELEKKLEIALSYLHVIKRLRNGKCFQCSDFAYRAVKKIKDIK